MRKNKLTQGVAPTWKMNTEGLTDEDLRVLESVNFPKEVRQGKVAFCRVIKNKVGGIFGRKESLLLDDLKYGQTSKAVAIVETQKNLSNIDKGKVKEMHKNGASANEMAKELGEDKKERIINYLKTL